MLHIFRPSIVELKFAKEVRVSDQSCSRKRASRTLTVSPLLLRGRRRGGGFPGRASFSLRLIRLWRNRQLARNDTQIIQRIRETRHWLRQPAKTIGRRRRDKQTRHCALGEPAEKD